MGSPALSERSYVPLSSDAGMQIQPSWFLGGELIDRGMCHERDVHVGPGSKNVLRSMGLTHGQRTVRTPILFSMWAICPTWKNLLHWWCIALYALRVAVSRHATKVRDDVTRRRNDIGCDQSGTGAHIGWSITINALADSVDVRGAILRRVVGRTEH